MKRNKPDYDVIVVGGGPAGSTAAYLLAAHGYHVCVVDKTHFPRPKLCAGLLTWKSIDLLHRVFGSSLSQLSKEQIVIHRCHNYRIYLGSQKIVQRRLDFPFHFVDRRHYDNAWLHQAQQAGCHITTGRGVVDVDANRGSITLEGGHKLHATILIGADGIWSKVRQAMQTKRKDQRKWRQCLATTIEARQPLALAQEDESYAAIYFGYMPWGYAWAFPGRDYRIVGIGGLAHKSGRSVASYYREFLGANHIDPNTLSAWQSHPLPYGNQIQPPAQGCALLVGDACGLADPLLGEGIFYAHRSGEIAATAIIGAESHPTRATDLYKKALNEDLIKELRWIKMYRNLLFVGGHHRRFRGLKLFFRWMPKRLEATVHGQRLFSELIKPGRKLPSSSPA